MIIYYIFKLFLIHQCVGSSGNVVLPQHNESKFKLRMEKLKSIPKKFETTKLL